MNALETLVLLAFPTKSTAGIVVAFECLKTLRIAAFAAMRTIPTIRATQLQGFVAPVFLPPTLIVPIAEKDVRYAIVDRVHRVPIGFFVAC